MAGMLISLGIYGYTAGMVINMLLSCCILGMMFSGIAFASFYTARRADPALKMLGIFLAVSALAFILASASSVSDWSDGSVTVYSSTGDVLLEYDGAYSITEGNDFGTYTFSWLQNGRVRSTEAVSCSRGVDGTRVVQATTDGSLSDPAMEILRDFLEYYLDTELDGTDYHTGTGTI